MYYFSLVFYSVAVTNPRKIRVTYKSDCQKWQFFVFGEVGLGYTDIPIEKFTIKMSSLTAVIPKLYHEYISKTPKKLKIIDAYLLYIFLTAVIQFVYCCLVGTFPFNSFLSGFISTVSSFVLGGKRYFWKYLFMPTDKSSSAPPQRPIQWAVKFFFCFQYACAYKPTQKTRMNSKVWVQSVDSLILYLLILYFTLLLLIS